MEIWINMALSIDGKLSQDPSMPMNFSSQNDRKHMRKIRGACDVIFVGAQTLRTDNPPFRGQEGKPSPHVIIFGRKALTDNFAVFKDNKRKVISFSPPHYNHPSLESALFDALQFSKDHGWERVLIEGGGRLYASILKARHVDRIYQTIIPTLLIDGHSINTENPQKNKLTQNNNFNKINYQLKSIQSTQKEIIIEWRKRKTNK